jgi:hypothetical protein
MLLCLCRGYDEGKYHWFGSEIDTTDALEEVFGAKEEDICWVTPVLDEHFTYHGSVLAGRTGTRHSGHGHDADDVRLADDWLLAARVLHPEVERVATLTYLCG